MTNIFIQFWFQGFAIGMIFTLVIYKIIYHIFWYNFKQNGKKNNLKTKRCKSCNNYFYIYDFETTKLCSNCILINTYSV